MDVRAAPAMSRRGFANRAQGENRAQGANPAWKAVRPSRAPFAHRGCARDPLAL